MSNLNLSIREFGCLLALNGSQMSSLEQHGISTVEDLLSKNRYDVINYHGFGKKTVDRIVEYLKLNGYDTTEFEKIPKRYSDKFCLKRPRNTTKPDYTLEAKEDSGYIIPTISFEGIPITREQFDLLKKRLEKTTGKTAFIETITEMMLTQPYHKALD